MRNSKTLTRATCWLLTLTMPLVWTGILPSAARAQAQSAVDADDAKAMAMLERCVEIGKRELAKLQDAAPDPAGQAAAQDFDVAKMFAFVRDQIRFEPYAGVLRGARGALVSRGGNAVDKALLLKEMLAAGGTTARLAGGTLSAEQAGTLVDAFLKADPLAGPLGDLNKPAAAGDDLAQFCQSAGLDPQQMAGVVADVEKRTAESRQAADTQTADAVTFLDQQVQANNLKLGQTARQWRDELAGRLTKHVWVQYQDADGKWIDLDPSFAANQPGQITAADAKPIDGDPAPHHVVNFTLVYATSAGKGVQDMPILSVPLNADEAMFRPASFAIMPGDTLPSPDKLMEMPVEERVKLVAQISKFQAVIRSGDRSFASKAFDLKGNTFDVAADGRIKGVSDIGHAAGGVFGGAMGGGTGQTEAGSDFDSLSLVVSFDTPPGQRPVPPQKRVLLTAADVKAEHSVSPLLDWEILIQPQLVSAAFGTTGSLQAMVATLEPVLAVSKKLGQDAGEPLAKLVNNLPSPYPHLLMNWSLFREEALAKAVAAKPDVAVLWDTPQVTVAERRFCMNKTSGHTCDRSRIDILNNALTVVPRQESAEAAAATLAMRQGVFDTVAEHVFLERIAPEGVVTSAAAELTAAKAAGGKFTAFTAANAGQSNLSKADQAFVQTCEADRSVLVPAGASAAASASAWWSIDAHTGSVVGRTSGGYGNALLENTMLQQIAGGILCFITAGVTAGSNKHPTEHDQRLTLMMFCACAISMGAGGATAVGASAAEKGFVAWLRIAMSIGVMSYKMSK